MLDGMKDGGVGARREACERFTVSDDDADTREAGADAKSGTGVG